MLPKQVGTSDAKRVYGDQAAGPPFKRMKGGASLRELQRDYAFFSYAPLVIYGGLDFNPVQEWINLNNHPQLVYVMQLDMPIFDMKGNPKLDRALWAVELEHWNDLCFHIGSLAIIDRKKQSMVRVVCQEIPILDVGALEKMRIIEDALPTVTVTTFSVDSNRECIAFDPAPDLLNSRPKLKRFKPREETVQLAKGIFARVETPYEGIQPLPWENESESNTTLTAT
jgi:hypothetical protein